MNVTRREVIAGFGTAAVVGAMVPRGVAQAADPEEPGFLDSGPTSGLDVPQEITLTSGLSYINLDPTAFGPILDSTGRNIDANFGVSVVSGTGGLMAPIILPVGSTLREATVGYVSLAGTPLFGVWRKPLLEAYTILNNVATTGLPLPAGPDPQTATVSLSEVIDGQSSYMVLINSITAASHRVHGVVVGYTPPPQGFIPISPVSRVLDTRTTGGKLNTNEERTVALGVPATAKAAVVNLTIVETEGAGFAAVFPADVAYPGNSNINWASADVVSANGVISAVDATGSVKIRCGGAGRTHVIIDVQGYLA